MKGKTPSILKKIITALSNKTKELRIRIMIFFLLHKNNIDKTSLTHSLHALVSQPPFHHHRKKAATPLEHAFVLEQIHNNGFLVHYNNSNNNNNNNNNDDDDGVLCQPNYEDEDEYEEEEEIIGGEDVDEVMEEEEEEEEENIDEAADLFIQRFKREIQLEKQFSLEDTDRHHQLLLQI